MKWPKYGHEFFSLVMKSPFGHETSFLSVMKFFGPSWIQILVMKIFTVMNSNSGHETFFRHEFKFWSWKFSPSWITTSWRHEIHSLRHEFYSIRHESTHLVLVMKYFTVTPQVSGITLTFAGCYSFYWLFFMNGTPSCTLHRYTRERSSNRWWHTPTYSTILNPFWRPDISSIRRFWGAFLRVPGMGCLQPRPGIAWRAQQRFGVVRLLARSV